MGGVNEIVDTLGVNEGLEGEGLNDWTSARMSITAAAGGGSAWRCVGRMLLVI